RSVRHAGTVAEHFAACIAADTGPTPAAQSRNARSRDELSEIGQGRIGPVQCVQSRRWLSAVPRIAAAKALGQVLANSPTEMHDPPARGQFAHRICVTMRADGKASGAVQGPRATCTRPLHSKVGDELESWDRCTGSFHGTCGRLYGLSQCR